MGAWGQGQSRAAGLTRAILDTFPVIKFSRSPVTERGEEGKTLDVETGRSVDSVVELGQIPDSRELSQTAQTANAQPPAAGQVSGERVDNAVALTVLSDIPRRKSD